MSPAWPAVALQWWSRRPAPLRWAPVLVEALLLWWSSSRSPGAGDVPVWRACLHNGAHVVAYAILGAATAIAFGRYPPRRLDALMATLIAASYGAVDEWHQASVPGRASSLADLMADCAGAAVGTLLLLVCCARDRLARHCLPAAFAAALLAVVLATWTSW